MLTINWCWKGAERLCPCCRISWYPKQTMWAGFVAQSVACWGNVFPPRSQTCRALWFNRPCGTHTGTSDSLFSLSLFSCFYPFVRLLSPTQHPFHLSNPLSVPSPSLLLAFKMSRIVTSPKNKAPQRLRLHKMLCFAISKCFWLLKSAAMYRLWGMGL